MMELTKKARKDYTDMIKVMETELLEQENSGTALMQQTPSGVVNPSTGSVPLDIVPKLFPHMGHSRTPSACSAISFCSSILSEPISENYPYSEPETDSRGYEIQRGDRQQRQVVGNVSEESDSKDVKEKLHKIDSDDSTSLNSSGGNKMGVSETLQEIDEGHEADTEDDPSGSLNKPRTDHRDSSGKSNSSDVHTVGDNSGTGSSNGNNNVVEVSKVVNVTCPGTSERKDTNDTITEDVTCTDVGEENDCEDNDGSVVYCGNSTDQQNSPVSNDDDDSLEDLPHFESLHNTTTSPSDQQHYHNIEILSQHSSKTLDHNSEVMSTHSSKTIEAGGGYNTPDQSSRNMGSTSDLREASTVSGSSNPPPPQKVKTVDKERIESWVAESRKQVELLSVSDNSTDSNTSVVEQQPECNGIFVDSNEIDVDVDGNDDRD